MVLRIPLSEPTLVLELGLERRNAPVEDLGRPREITLSLGSVGVGAL